MKIHAFVKDGLENKKLSVIYKDYHRDPLFENKYYLSEIDRINKQIILEHKLLIARQKDFKSKIVNGLVESLRSDFNLTDEETELLREGFLDALQHGIGSLAGGINDFLRKVGITKIPKEYQAAYDKYDNLVDKEVDDTVKELMNTTEEEVDSIEAGLGGKGGEFPVNKNRTGFLTGINTIAAFYDSIVTATEKEAGGDGYIDPSVANKIISDVRVWVNKLLMDTETKKGGMYRLFGGKGELGGEGFTKDTGAAKSGEFIEVAELSETEGGVEEVDVEKQVEQMSADLYNTLSSQLTEQEGDEEGSEEEKTEVVKVDPDAEAEKMLRGQASPVLVALGSLKAPLVLAGIGVALGSLAWLSQTDAMAGFVKEIIGEADGVTVDTDVDTLVDKTKVINDTTSSMVEEMVPAEMTQSGDGLFRLVNRAHGGPKISTIGDWKDALTEIGGGDLDRGIMQVSDVGRHPGQAASAFKEFLTGPGALSDDASVWKMFSAGTKYSGGLGAAAGKAGTFALQPKSTLYKVLQQKVTQGITRTVTEKVPGKIIKKVTYESAKGVAASAAVASLGPVLAGLGVAFVGAGATLALLRQRAKKASRTGVLNDLLQALNPVPEPVPEIPADQEDLEIEITLFSESFNKMLRNKKMLMSERTEVNVKGLAGTEEIEKVGGVYNFVLDSVPFEYKGETLDDFVKAGYKKLSDDLIKQLKDVDLGAAKIIIVDKRTGENVPVPEDESPPVPVNPGNIAKGQHAVVVFTGANGAEVWRILKKKTFRKYASDAKRSKDKDAPEFMNRFKNYDSILGSLRADGVFVNTKDLEGQLSKISSGRDGGQHRVSYTRTRKNKKTGEVTKRKSVTGGYTKAGDVKSISDIHNNILGANKRKPRNVGDYTVIYLVGNDVVNSLTGKGMEKDAAQSAVQKALSLWSKNKKKPKSDELGLDNEDAVGILRTASLVESKRLKGHQYLMIVINEAKFKKIINYLTKDVDLNFINEANDIINFYEKMYAKQKIFMKNSMFK